MRSYLQSNDELASETHVAHDENKSSIAEMIKQASLLADIMKEIQEDKARSRANEHGLDEVSENGPKAEESSSLEHELERPLEKQEEVKAVEVEPAGEEPQAKKEPVTIALEDETTQESPEEETDEPQRLEEWVIKSSVGLDATLFYLQTRTVRGLNEEVKRLEAKEEGEGTPVVRPPPVIEKSDEYREEE